MIRYQSVAGIMKHLLILLLAFTAVCCGSREVSRSETGKVIEISAESLKQGAAEMTVDMGRLHEGEIVRYDAWLKNMDSRPLIILGVETSCGCTAVEYERKPIAPGDRGRFCFTFDSRGMWHTQSKRIEIRTSASQSPLVLTVRAFVETDDLQ